jgi:hypothetical protein
MHLLANDIGTGQIFLSMLWFFMFFIWLWLLITVFGDIFRSQDLSGGMKAIWTIFVIIFPYLGVFVYLLARGGKMHEHAVQAVAAQDQAARAYIQNAVSTGSSSTDQIAQLANLKAQGVIDEAEFQKMKAKVVG